MRYLRLLFSFVLAFGSCSELVAQEVVSARSGMVHFTEGRVFLNEHPLSRKSGAYPAIKEGSTLRTEKGRAEVLLTPGVFLRLDEDSSIRMISTGLADTRLAFLKGTVILDASDAAGLKNAITIAYKDASVRFSKAGVYRLDDDTGVLQAYSGEAEITYSGKQTRLDSSHLFFCWLGLATNKLGAGTEDEFYDWASDREEVIGQENQLAEQTGRDAGDADPDPGAALGSNTVPYLGSPGAIPPSGGVQSYPAPYSLSPYSSYPLGSTLFDPFLSFTTAPYLPFGYPVLVLRRPSHVRGTPWPHRTDNSVWHRRVTAGAMPLPPRLPAHVTMPGPNRVSVPLGALRPSAPRIGVSAGPAVRPAAPAFARPTVAPARPMPGHAAPGRR